MGDTGSLMLGALFAILTICFNEMTPANHTNNQAWAFPAISLAIMIVPVIDSIRIIYVRISQGHSPFTADMNHIHHQMIKITSKNHLHATIIMVLFNLGFICLSLGFIDQLGNNILFFGLLVAGFAVAGIPFFINKSKEKNSRTSKSPDVIGSDTNQESGIPEKEKNGTTKTTRENYANMDKIQSN